jgi:hypothetical protein
MAFKWCARAGLPLAKLLPAHPINPLQKILLAKPVNLGTGRDKPTSLHANSHAVCLTVFYCS